MIGAKHCSKCRKEKALELFGKDKSRTDGLYPQCTECFRSKNREAARISSAKARLNPEKRAKRNAASALCSARTRSTSEGRVKANAAVAASNVKFKALHGKARPTIRKRQDPMFKLTVSMRTLIASCFILKGWKKSTKTQQLLGCSFEELAMHLQAKFKEGMTLENHGLWHIDHIIPCASATTSEELVKLQHYTNLQPLWASENRAKGAKL